MIRLLFLCLLASYSSLGAGFKAIHIFGQSEAHTLPYFDAFLWVSSLKKVIAAELKVSPKEIHLYVVDGEDSKFLDDDSKTLEEYGINEETAPTMELRVGGRELVKNFLPVGTGDYSKNKWVYQLDSSDITASIASLKERMARANNVDANDIEWSIDGAWLKGTRWFTAKLDDNEKTLTDYGITEENFHLASMHVDVKSTFYYFREIYCFGADIAPPQMRVTDDMTVSSLKKAIAKKINISVEDIRYLDVSPGAKSLASDELRLIDYGITRYNLGQRRLDIFLKK